MFVDDCDVLILLDDIFLRLKCRSLTFKSFEVVKDLLTPKSIMSFMRSTSPLPLPANHQHDCMSAATKRYKYLRRMLKFDQMDFEFATWQMLYLFIAPQKVYKNFHYRKRMII